MTSKVVYQGDLRTKNTHLRSDVSFFTDAPVDNNGKGASFSPSDTVATGLASCMLTIMGIKAKGMGLKLENTYAEVTKTMAAEPRRISKIEICLYFPESYDQKTHKILENAAKTCPVAQSLHPDIEQVISFKYKEA